MRCCRLEDLSTLTTDAASQLDVLGHDGDTLGVNGSQVGVLKQTNKVCLSSLLESQDSRGLEPQVSLEVLGDLTHQPLERQLADQQLGGLLVLPDLTQGDGSRPVSVRLQYTFQASARLFSIIIKGQAPVAYRSAETSYLLDTSSCGCALPCGLSGQLLAGCLATSGLTGCLLGTSHGNGTNMKARSL